MNSEIKTKTLLVLGGGVTQMDVIRVARRLGLKVVVVDENPNVPGFKTGDPEIISLPINFSNVEKVLSVIKEQDIRIDAVIAYGSDLAVLPSAQIASKLGLRSISEESAKRASDKLLMRRFWKKEDIPIPKYFLVQNFDEAKSAAQKIGYPVVIKPTDSAAQRGVRKVSSDEELKISLKEAFKFTKKKFVFVEEYIKGSEIAVSTFTVRNKTQVFFITDRITSPPPYIGICLAHIYPSGIKDSEMTRVLEIIPQVVKCLGISLGPTYSQVKISQGVPYIMETGARLGGGRDSELYYHLTGKDPITAHIKQLLGIDSGILEDFRLENIGTKGGVVKFLIHSPGRLKALRGIKDAWTVSGVKGLGFFFQTGEEIPSLTYGGARLGYVIAVGEDRTKAYIQAEKGASFIKPEIE